MNQLKLTKELAEIAGMFAADGSLQKEHLCMWGNIYEDKDYYDNIVCPLFSKAFDIQIKAHEKRSNSVYGFYICNKNIIKFFNEYFEFPYGKKTYTVSVPKVILDSNNREIYSAFIRGFTDCDGCLNFEKRYTKNYHYYPRILLVSVSMKIVHTVSDMLNKIHIMNNVLFRKKYKANETDCYEIFLRGNNKLEQWINMIGFNNPSKMIKYLIWKKFGFCPVNINLEEKKNILSGKLDPHSFYK